jgi:hypothetical protein
MSGYDLVHRTHRSATFQEGRRRPADY